MNARSLRDPDVIQRQAADALESVRLSMRNQHWRVGAAYAQVATLYLRQLADIADAQGTADPHEPVLFTPSEERVAMLQHGLEAVKKAQVDPL